VGEDDDYDVLENGAVVGHIFKEQVAPKDRPWMWASGHNGDIRRAPRTATSRRVRTRWRRSREAGDGNRAGAAFGEPHGVWRAQ
jgi:hypothetical protein